MLRNMPPQPLVPPELKLRPFTLDRARELGLARWHLEGASWKRVARGTYMWTAAADTPVLRLTALLGRLPSSAAFSGMTAAWLHGLDVEPCRPIEVTVPHEIGVSSRAGVRLRRAICSQEDVVSVRGLPALGALRTVAEICMRLPLVEAVVIGDAALHLGLVTTDELRGWAQGRPRWPGIRRLRDVIKHVEPLAESPMESRLRMLLVLAGLSRPRAQVEIRDSRGRLLGRPDLYYEDERLGIEYDGSGHKNTMVADNHRQNNLLGAGVRLLRFAGVDVLEDPASVVEHVRAQLDRHEYGNG